MKKLASASLFIFFVVVTAILTSGLVFYQNNKDSTSVQVSGLKVSTITKNKINQLSTDGKSLVLNLSEITRHNKQLDCWLLINDNVYDITSFFGSHPGGNAAMLSTCGTDATDAYMTKDPNAATTTGGKSHSSNARNMLKDYYLGTLNQSIGNISSSNNTNTTTVANIDKRISVSSTSTSSLDNTKTNTITKLPVASGGVVLNLPEISKHNKQSDCWLLISGKVYNITSFFGSHPGGNAAMLATCGTDATDAYMTKDPNATTTTGGKSHSSNARSMLTSYYIGDVGQTIGQQTITNTNSVVAPKTRWGDQEDD